jgi:NAD(P)-dependent dehydrogenase (short-subunit alcohol dehydrogenase family)
MKLGDKYMNVLITGASRGLGLALAEFYARNHHEVIATARNTKNADKLLKLAKEYHNITVLDMDVASWTSIEACSKEVSESFQTLDLIMNNADVLFESDKTNRIMEVEVEALQTTMAINVEGPILVLKAFYPLLQKSVHPKFYTITSESTLENSWYGIPIYSLSKVAANKVASIIKASVGDHYEVLAIHPGRMNTDMGKATSEIEAEEAAAGIYEMSVGQRPIENWYVDYLGQKMNS